MPVVSAVITTFNRARYLGAAIQSVLAQTFDDFELLVLDNQSTDGTAQVVAGFHDPRLRYIRHEPLPIAHSRNLGVREAAGECIGFLDDDDEWLPRKLELQVALLRQAPSEVALVYGGFTRIDEVGVEFASHTPVLRGRILHDLLWHRDAFTGSASNPLMRITAVRALGCYDESLLTSEDWELYLRLAERYAVEYVPDAVVRIRSHRGPRLGDRVADAMAVEQLVLDRYGGRMDAALRSYYLQKIGGKLCRIGQNGRGRVVLLQAIGIQPSNILAYGQLALSFLGAGGYRRAHLAFKQVQRAIDVRTKASGPSVGVGTGKQ